jgi:hypothetical protein
MRDKSKSILYKSYFGEPVSRANNLVVNPHVDYYIFQPIEGADYLHITCGMGAAGYSELMLCTKKSYRRCNKR